ncbi:MAG TPA: hypothetical protein VFT87_05760 [Candidatus Saccharimonadales bacterium]|nr:hypothetical protein [Candidatus Saccharimonadales bacterium]
MSVSYGSYLTLLALPAMAAYMWVQWPKTTARGHRVLVAWLLAVAAVTVFTFSTLTAIEVSYAEFGRVLIGRDMHVGLLIALTILIFALGFAALASQADTKAFLLWCMTGFTITALLEAADRYEPSTINATALHIGLSGLSLLGFIAFMVHCVLQRRQAR